MVTVHSFLQSVSGTIEPDVWKSQDARAVVSVLFTPIPCLSSFFKKD